MIIPCPQCSACNPVVMKPSKKDGNLIVNLEFQCHKCKSIFSLVLNRLRNGQMSDEVCGYIVFDIEKVPHPCKLNKGHEGGHNPYEANLHSDTVLKSGLAGSAKKV